MIITYLVPVNISHAYTHTHTHTHTISERFKGERGKLINSKSHRAAARRGLGLRKSLNEARLIVPGDG